MSFAEKVVKFVAKNMPYKVKTKRFLKKCFDIKPYPTRVSDYISKENSRLWKDYINSSDFQNKLDALKNNLDEESLLTVDSIVERMKFFAAVSDYSESCYFHLRDLLSEKEIEGQIEVTKFNCEEKFKDKLPTKFFEQSVLYFHSGLKFLPKKALEYLKSKDFIDGGACIGDSALIFSEYAPDKIYAFEPIEENIQFMQKTISLNNLENVVPVKLGLGEEKGTIKIVYSSDCVGNSSSTFSQQGEEREIEIVTVDDYVNENNLKFGLLKLDVEGLESFIIKGATQSIKEYRPVLLVSIYHNPSDFFEIKSYIESLDAGYKFMVRKLVCGCAYGETMLIAYPQELAD